MDEKVLKKVVFYVVPQVLDAPDLRYERYTTLEIPELVQLLENRFGANKVKISSWESVGFIVSALPPQQTQVE